MANAIYPKYKQSLLSADASLDLLQTTANVAPYVVLVVTSSGYTYSASDQYYSALGSNTAGTDQQLGTLATTSGTFSAANSTFTSVATGPAVGALVIYRKNAGANTTWRLVMYEDTGVTGLPVTPNGGNIVITWNASGIFTVSDCRLKKDIEYTGYTIEGFNLYYYNYNWEEGRGQRQRQRQVRQRHIGFMAQEVEKVFPDAVVRLVPSGYKAVDYERVLQRMLH
jgi:hypothetical protein